MDYSLYIAYVYWYSNVIIIFYFKSLLSSMFNSFKSFFKIPKSLTALSEKSGSLCSAVILIVVGYVSFFVLDADIKILWLGWFIYLVFSFLALFKEPIIIFTCTSFAALKTLIYYTYNCLGTKYFKIPKALTDLSEKSGSLCSAVILIVVGYVSVFMLDADIKILCLGWFIYLVFSFLALFKETIIIFTCASFDALKTLIYYTYNCIGTKYFKIPKALTDLSEKSVSLCSVVILVVVGYVSFFMLDADIKIFWLGCFMHIVLIFLTLFKESVIIFTYTSFDALKTLIYYNYNCLSTKYFKIPKALTDLSEKSVSLCSVVILVVAGYVSFFMLDADIKIFWLGCFMHIVLIFLTLFKESVIIFTYASFDALKTLIYYTYNCLETKYLFLVLVHKDFIILNMFTRFVNWSKGTSTFYNPKTNLVYRSNNGALEFLFLLFFSVILLSIFSLSSYFIFLLESLNAISTEVSNVVKVRSHQWFWEYSVTYKYNNFYFVEGGSELYPSIDLFYFYCSKWLSIDNSLEIDDDVVLYSGDLPNFKFNSCIVVSGNNTVFMLSKDPSMGAVSNGCYSCLDDFSKFSISELGFSIVSISESSVIVKELSTGEELCYSLIPGVDFTYNNEGVLVFVNLSDASAANNNFKHDNNNAEPSEGLGPSDIFKSSDIMNIPLGASEVVSNSKGGGDIVYSYFNFIDKMKSLFDLDESNLCGEVDTYNKFRHNCEAAPWHGDWHRWKHEEFLNSFQKELISTASIGDLILSKALGHMAHGPTFGPIEQGVWFRFFSPGLYLKILTMENRFHVPLRLLQALDLRDIAIVLAYTDRPSLEELTASEGSKLIEAFISKVRYILDPVNNEDVFGLSCESMNPSEKLELISKETKLFLDSYDSNLKSNVKKIVDQACYDAIGKCFTFSTSQKNASYGRVIAADFGLPCRSRSVFYKTDMFDRAFMTWLKYFKGFKDSEINDFMELTFVRVVRDSDGNLVDSMYDSSAAKEKMVEGSAYKKKFYSRYFNHITSIETNRRKCTDLTDEGLESYFKGNKIERVIQARNGIASSRKIKYAISLYKKLKSVN